jgi:hypothetical protein
MTEIDSITQIRTSKITFAGGLLLLLLDGDILPNSSSNSSSSISICINGWISCFARLMISSKSGSSFYIFNSNPILDIFC